MLKLSLTALLTAGLLGLATADDDALQHHDLERIAPRLPLQSEWILSWDDSLDGELDSQDKFTEVALERIDSTITDRFTGSVLGTQRTATFTGELAGQGAGALLMLQQREPGYVCAYQLSPEGERGWSGTWRDSQGRAGTVALEPAVLVTPRTDASY